jgi:hypothetical protein
MTREEIEKATPEQLNKWAAESMGWMETFIGDVLSDKYIDLVIGKEVYFRHVNHFVYRLGNGNDDTWNPAQSIQDAFELAERLNEKEDCLSLNYQAGLYAGDFSKLGWSATFRTSGKYAIDDNPSKAITKAFLLAVNNL